MSYKRDIARYKKYLGVKCREITDRNAQKNAYPTAHEPVKHHHVDDM